MPDVTARTIRPVRRCRQRVVVSAASAVQTTGQYPHPRPSSDAHCCRWKNGDFLRPCSRPAILWKAGKSPARQHRTCQAFLCRTVWSRRESEITAWHRAHGTRFELVQEARNIQFFVSFAVVQLRPEGMFYLRFLVSGTLKPSHYGLRVVFVHSA